MKRRRGNRKNRRKMNLLLAILLIVILALGIFGGSALIEYNSDNTGTGETVTVEIEQGEGVWDIAGKLKAQDFIKYRIVFCLKAMNMDATGQLRYGIFEISKGAGVKTIIEELISGGAQKAETMFTVPEGYTIEMIAKKLEEEHLFTETEFLAAARQDYDYWFLEDMPSNTGAKYKLQGFLYPDTYAIGEGMTAEDLITVMLNQFDEKFTTDMQDKMKAQGKTIYEIVIEASIIERETMVDSERATVAGVIKNRLERDMRLQMCPTVLYPLTNGLYDKDTVTTQDTKLDSPYNTYRNPGLPVGPIANPGLPSLEAALNPQEHEYLYYHTNTDKNDGSHIFTKTFEEHKNTR